MIALKRTRQREVKVLMDDSHSLDMLASVAGASLFLVPGHYRFAMSGKRCAKGMFNHSQCSDILLSALLLEEGRLFHFQLDTPEGEWVSCKVKEKREEFTPSPLLL